MNPLEKRSRKEKMDKTGKILPSQYLIGIIVFTFFIVGGTSILGILNDSDPTFTDDEKFTEFNRSFNKLNEVTTSVESLETEIIESDPQEGVLGFLDSLISSSWNSLKLIFTSLDFMDDAFGAIANVFGLPTWVGGLITLLITVVLIFAIWGAIFQRDL